LATPACQSTDACRKRRRRSNSINLQITFPLRAYDTYKCLRARSVVQLGCSACVRLTAPLGTTADVSAVRPERDYLCHDPLGMVRATQIRICWWTRLADEFNLRRRLTGEAPCRRTLKNQIPSPRKENPPSRLTQFWAP
jgi:hypothetical protein